MASLYYIKKEHKSNSFVFNHKYENNKKEKNVSTVYMFHIYIHIHYLVQDREVS